MVLTKTDQNRSWNAATNDEGSYVFVQIPPGKYTLSVEAKGFKKYQHTSMTLEVAQIAALDVVLDLGAVTEVVEVSTQVALLETASSTLDAVVNSKTADALPLNGRNILQLVALTPGINATRSFRGATNGDGSIVSNAFSANGGRDVSSEIMLDGSPQIVIGYNQPAYVPTPDALQESGQPVSVSSAANTTDSFNGTQRPNSTGISSQTPGSIKQRVDSFFNPAAFTNAPKYAFGNVSRNLPNNLGPALQVWDLSVLKHIPIHEAKQLEFRAEFFNLFNNVNFLLPDGDSATFGRPQFGTLLAAERARIIQFALKLRY